MTEAYAPLQRGSALKGLRVVDFSSGLAGPYCTKLFADAGADVVKVESESGDPLRMWTASKVDLGGADGPLFRFLNASKRSVVGEPGDAAVATLVSLADIVVDDGRLTAETIAALQAQHSGVTVASITPFGLHGPLAGSPAAEFTLQAMTGVMARHQRPGKPPTAVGGRLGEWITGSYAALGALAGFHQAAASGRGPHVDVAMIECMSFTMDPYTWVRGAFTGRRPPGMAMEIPAIEPTADGHVGITTITGQQFQDFLIMIERADLLGDDDLASAAGRLKRQAEIIPMIHAWLATRTTEEVLQAAADLRIPAAPIGNGEALLRVEHLAERGVFVRAPGGGFVQPRPPYAISGVGLESAAPAPALGEHTGEVAWEPRTAPSANGENQPGGPLTGVRVLDLTAFWAGPSATHLLTALGAEVIKLESIQRPDAIRFNAARRPPEDNWWETSWIFHVVNAGKRGITVDLGRSEGQALVRKLIAECDAVVENFTPRVMEQFGLEWPEIETVNPRAILVRMPAFGLTGPWRDKTGFAQTMEQLSGLAWTTGWPDGPPIMPGGACDPLAGVHAMFALLVALEQRRRTGHGAQVEATMVEVAINIAAEQVVEYTATGHLLNRAGNRGPVGAPQGVYAAVGADEWVAISVTNDQQWVALGQALGDPPWATDPSFKAEAGRRAAHDELDTHLSAWCGTLPAVDIVETLMSAGVPAAVVTSAGALADNQHLRARGYFERRAHPIIGEHDYPAIPLDFADRPRPLLREPAPTIGQHNDDVLERILGIGAPERDALRRDNIIGERPLGV